MKVLLIGWDAAGWEQLHPLLERGEMPHLQRLLSRGSGGELHPVRPFESASLWTTVATGKRPTKHRVLGNLDLSPDRTELVPVQRGARQTVAVWDILAHGGLRTHVVNWPASHPAAAAHGVTVSDGLLTGAPDGWVSPASLQPALAELRLDADEVDDASLAALNAALPADDAEPLRAFVAASASVHAAVTWLLEHQPWDFAAVRYSGLPAIGRCSERTLAGGYRFHDMMLGRLLGLAGAEASVVLVSECGSPLGQGTPGIAAVAGRGFVEGRLLTAANVCDVTPTILHLFGLPRGQDMDGLPWRQVMTPADRPLATRPTWEIIPGAPANCRRQRRRRPRHITAAVAASRPVIVEAFETDQKRRLAEAFADAGQHDQAARALEDLVRHEPSSIPYRSALAEAYFRANRRPECRRVIDALRADGVDTPLLHVGLAALDLADGRADDARAHLQRAITTGPLSGDAWEAIGRLLLRLHDAAGADRAFAQSIALRPERAAAAHAGRAAVALLARDPAAAEAHARRALAAQPRSFEAHCHLARALARQKRHREAAEVLDAAASIDPTAAERQRRLLNRPGPAS